MTDVAMNLSIYISGAWTDITSDVQGGLTASWGLSGNKPSDKISKVGTLNFTLDNSKNKYTPKGASAYVGWQKGTPVKVVFTYLGQTYTRFRAYVDRIEVDAGSLGSRKVRVTALDWVDFANKYPLNIPAVELNKTADYALNKLVTAMPVVPQSTSYNVGNSTFPTLFDYATTATTALAEFKKLADSEVGFISVNKDKTNGEQLVFRNFASRSGLAPLSKVFVLGDLSYWLQEDGTSFILQEDDTSKIILDNDINMDVSISGTGEIVGLDADYGSKINNYYTVSAYPKNMSTTSLIYSLENPIRLQPYQKKQFRIQYTDPNSKRTIAATAPISDGTITLLKGEGGAFKSVITDETGRAWVNPNQDVQTVDTIYKYGISSLYFDGSSSYIYTTNANDFNFSGNSFTIEWWEYRFGAAAGATVCRRDGVTVFPAFAIGRSDGAVSRIDMSSNGLSNDIANNRSLGAIATNTWVHYAVCRQGATFYAFQNGSLTDTWTSSSSLAFQADDFVIGKNGATYLNACIDEFRIINGTALYTTAFTPPTEGFNMAGLFYTASTTPTGGIDVKTSVTVTPTYGGVGADISVTNFNSIECYVTTLKIYSNVVQSNVPIYKIDKNDTSIATYGYQTGDISMPYQQDTDVGEIEARRNVDENRVPRTTIDKVSMIANKSSFLMNCFLNMDVGNYVRLAETQTEIDSYFWINGVDFTLTPTSTIANGVVVDFSWTVKEQFVLGNKLSPISVQFALTSDYINFGSPSYLYGQNKRTISAWIFPTNATPAASPAYFYHGGTFLGHQSTAVTRAFWYEACIGGDASWITPLNSLTLNSWNHIVFVRDTSIFPLNPPSGYINGVKVTMTAQTSPVGAPKFNNNSLYIGNTYNQTNLFYGQIKDVRIHNDILTNTEISSIYNGGTPSMTAGITTGTKAPVFQSFVVSTSELASYTDATLTNNLRVRDSVFGVVGEINSSGFPVGKTF